MCNLYSLTTNQEAIRRLFGTTRDRTGNLPFLPAIFPGHDAPVVRLAVETDRSRELVMMSWGFVLPQPGRVPKRITNARDARRCLVPASSFAEPKGKKPAVWHWFGLQPQPDDPRPAFAFAGIWRHWTGQLHGATVALDVVAILTTTPNELVQPVHPERMPVILHPDDYHVWLTGSVEAALALASPPYPASQMALVKTGDKADDPTSVAASNAVPSGLL